MYIVQSSDLKGKKSHSFYSTIALGKNELNYVSLGYFHLNFKCLILRSNFDRNKHQTTYIKSVGILKNWHNLYHKVSGVSSKLTYSKRGYPTLWKFDLKHMWVSSKTYKKQMWV